MRKLAPMFDPATNVEIRKRLQQHIEAGTTDTAAGEIEVDPVKYFDPAWAAREREAVFGRTPIVVAHASELPDPHDFRTVSVAGTSVLLVRQEDGSVRAFANRCRHRSAPVATDPGGNRRVFSCPYHAWSYNSDGSLRAVTYEKSFGDVGDASRGLVRLPCEEHRSLIWVITQPGTTIDVRDYLGPEMDHVLSSYALDGYVHQHTLKYDEPANWKIILEAALDNYHLRFLHPKTVGKYFHTNLHTFDQMGRHGRFVTARKAIRRLWDMPDDTPIDPYVIVGIYLWPNCLLVGQPDHFELWSFFPDPASPGQSRTEIKFLLPGHVTSDEDREFLMRNVAILTQALDDEDMPMSREIQDNLDRSGTTTMIFGRNEPMDQLVHRGLNEVMAAPEARR
jgi:phenylpropionate dioxygenase-like ring-hydroxylating dioxygenase large terminal subunit